MTEELETRPQTLGELWLFVAEQAEVGRHVMLVAEARGEEEEAMVAAMQWHLLTDVAEKLRSSIDGLAGRLQRAIEPGAEVPIVLAQLSAAVTVEVVGVGAEEVVG